MQSEVRLLNNLLICNPSCTAFTAPLTASQGYTWFSTSGTYSAYQLVTTPTLSNFTGEAIGYGITLGCTCSFNITSGRRYALWTTLDAANNITLLLFDEGAMSALAPQQLGSPAAAPMSRQGDPSIRFAPALETPIPR